MPVTVFVQRNERVLMPCTRMDEAALSDLVSRYNSDLLRVCYVILGDAALAEDAAQSAWIQAWKKIHQLRDDQKLRSWLLAVAANEARQIARRRRRLPVGQAVDGSTGDLDPRLADLKATLSRLTADDRRLLGLRYVSGLSSGEIAEAVGISSGAVRHRLMRLLARMRDELGG